MTANGVAALEAAAILTGIHEGIREQLDPGQAIAGNDYAQTTEFPP